MVLLSYCHFSHKFNYIRKPRTIVHESFQQLKETRQKLHNMDLLRQFMFKVLALFMTGP